MQQHSPKSTPQALAEIRQYLSILLLATIAVNIVVIWLTIDVRAPQVTSLLPLLAVARSAAIVLMVITLYVAAKRLGFSTVRVVIAIILSLLILPLGLVLAVSAYFRLTQQLRKAGWKTSLLTARPA